jgi:hypothetical protein
MKQTTETETETTTEPKSLTPFFVRKTSLNSMAWRGDQAFACL